MKRAEKAKRKAASSTSDGEVVAAESDDSRQGATELHKFLNWIVEIFSYFKSET